MLLGALVDSSGAFSPVVLLTWPLNVGVVISAAAAVRRNSDSRFPQQAGRSRARAWGTLAFSFIILLAQTGIADRTLARIRMVAKSAVTASDLRGIGQAINLYGQEHGDYPPEFDVLVATGVLVPQQLVSRSDSTPASFDLPDGPPCYTSFVYRPG